VGSCVTLSLSTLSSPLCPRPFVLSLPRKTKSIGTKSIGTKSIADKVDSGQSRGDKVEGTKSRGQSRGDKVEGTKSRGTKSTYLDEFASFLTINEIMLAA
jgi:hypothetical protein